MFMRSLAMTRRRSSGSAGAVVFFSVLLVLGAPGLHAQARLTLEELLDVAHSDHPALAESQARVDAAFGRLELAQTRPFNPAIGLAAGPRRSADSTVTNVEVQLQQTFELGGKRSARSSAARYAAEAAEQFGARDLLRVSVGVKTAFAVASVTHQQLVASRDQEALARRLEEQTAQRLERGAGTQLEVNVAAAALARATRDRLMVESRHRTALQDLALAAGLEAGRIVEPDGGLPRLDSIPDLAVLLTRARTRRGDVRAAESLVLSSRAGVEAADRMRWPDASISIGLGRDEGDPEARFGLSFSLPLLNRNQGERAVARAEADRARARRTAADRLAEAQVRDAHQAFLAAQEARDAFGADVLGRLAENLVLAQRSLDAGKIDLTDLSVFRRDLIDTQLAFLDAALDVHVRYYELELAAGGEIGR